MAGIALGPAIVLAGSDPYGRVWPWAALTAVFLALLLHRLSLVYEVAGGKLTAYSWWGLGRPEAVTVWAIESAEVMRGLALSACGCGHVHVRSSLPEEGGLTILAQAKPEALAEELEALARAARRQAESDQAEGGLPESDPGEDPEGDPERGYGEEI